MFGLFKPKNPEAHRYYLLPGMARSNRRHRSVVLRRTLIVAAIFCAILGTVIYIAQSPRQFFW